MKIGTTAKSVLMAIGVNHIIALILAVLLMPIAILASDKPIALTDKWRAVERNHFIKLDSYEKNLFWIKRYACKENCNHSSNDMTSHKYTLSLYEVNCSKHVIRQLSRHDYEHNNELIDSNTQPTKWNRIVTDSYGELYFLTVCITQMEDNK